MSDRKPKKSRPLLDLGVLDLCTVHPGRTVADSLAETVALARLAEELGYSRFWIAEHHAPGSAQSSPEILLPLLAARTERIRVGSGGVLLPFYSAFKIAENFRLLSVLFPGRVELGVGRGGVEPAAAEALLDGAEPALAFDRYRERLTDLLGHLHGNLPKEHPRSGARAYPEGVEAPPVWVLGSGVESMSHAASLGTAFSFALFLTSSRRDGENVLEAYRENFRPGTGFAAPRASIAVAGVCAEDEEEAFRLASGLKNPAFRQTVVGTPTQCREQLEDLSRRYGTQEILFATLCDDPGARARSYRLLAEACGLRPPTG